MSQINQVKDQIKYQKNLIIEKQAEIEATTAKYDGELEKYYKYSGEKPKATQETAAVDEASE